MDILLSLSDVYLVKHILQSTRKQSALRWIRPNSPIGLRRTQNCICLSRSSLSIGKNASIVSSETMVCNILPKSLEKVNLQVGGEKERNYLWTILVKYRVKDKIIICVSSVSKRDVRRMWRYAGRGVYKLRVKIGSMIPPCSLALRGLTLQNTLINSLLDLSSMCIGNWWEEWQNKFQVNDINEFKISTKRPPIQSAFPPSVPGWEHIGKSKCFVVVECGSLRGV